MKNLVVPVFTVLNIFIINSCSSQLDWTGMFDYYPEKPKPGEEITIFYSADSTKFANLDKIDMNVYLYSKKLDNTVGVEMNKTKAGWVGKVKTNRDTRGIIIKFKSDDDIDNNSKKGYVIYLYGSDGKVLPGSIAGFGVAKLNWGSYYVDVDRNIEAAMQYLQEDFQNNPEIKEEYLDPYLTIYEELYPDKIDSTVTTELSKLEMKEELTEDDLVTLTDWYGKINNEDKSDQFKKILSEKFPQSEYLQIERYRELRSEQDLAKKKQLAVKFAKDFPESEYIENAYDLVANLYRDKKLYREVRDFLKTNFNLPSVYRFYSVSNRMFEENADLNITLEIARMGVKRGEQEVKNPASEKPEYLTEKEWKEDRDYYLGLTLFSLGKALDLFGKKAEALQNLERAVKLTQNNEGSINELYVSVLYENGEKQKARTVIEDFIKKGDGTEGMTGVLKNVYVSGKGSEEGFEEYLSKLESVSLGNLKDKLSKEIINEPALDFSLEDLDGKEVSLSSLKGKTVIVDFWATWCGPCINSFPGMQKAVDKYSQNENVKFLFISSWEREEDRKSTVEKFLQKYNYTFHILMDYDDKVISEYNVTGIPTKFVIDKKGNIRFKSIGFYGNVDQLADEVSVMIDLAEQKF
jgi:peroxiredoxin